MTKKALVLFVSVTVFIFVGLFYFSYFSSDNQTSEEKIEKFERSIPIETEASVPVSDGRKVNEEPFFSRHENKGEEVINEPEFFLPILDESDPMVRQASSSMTSRAGLAGLLSADQLLRKFVAITVNAASGKVAREAISHLIPDQPFRAREIGKDEFEIDYRSYDRFNNMVDLIYSIDSRRAAEFYFLVRPLLIEAFKELGYPEDVYDKVVFKAIEKISETPDFAERIILTRPVVMYQYKDPGLEKLPPLQKQVMRTGPRNSQLLKEKAAEFGRELKSVLDQ
ncbi:MAG: hypothetical protein CMQ40_02850 [Gammaproteobacteria bacterium]|nr:hypothetical protein [Gammaproteobacteria bacterium]